MSIPNIQNKILKKISRFDFLIDGQENEEDAGPVQLEFDDGSVLEMELVPDGESVKFTWKDKATAEKGDKATGWFSIDLSRRKPFDQLCNEKVKDSDELLFGTIEDKREEMVVAAYGFRFYNGRSLVYYNAGDYAKIYVDKMPTELPAKFKLIWKNGIFKDRIS